VLLLRFAKSTTDVVLGVAGLTVAAACVLGTWLCALVWNQCRIVPRAPLPADADSKPRWALLRLVRFISTHSAVRWSSHWEEPRQQQRDNSDRFSDSDAELEAALAAVASNGPAATPPGSRDESDADDDADLEAEAPLLSVNAAPAREDVPSRSRADGMLRRQQRRSNSDSVSDSDAELEAALSAGVASSSSTEGKLRHGLDAPLLDSAAPLCGGPLTEATASPTAAAVAPPPVSRGIGGKRQLRFVLDDMQLPWWAAVEVTRQFVTGAILGFSDGSSSTCKRQVGLLLATAATTLLLAAARRPCGSHAGNFFLGRQTSAGSLRRC
jgi:hypothetical protein